MIAMSGNKKENLSTEKDNIEEEEDVEAKDSDFDENDSQTSCENVHSYRDSEYRKSLEVEISIKNLKRRPLHPKKENVPKETKEHCSDANNKRKKHLSATPEPSKSSSSYILPFLICLGTLMLLGVFFYITSASSSSTNKQLDVKKLMKELKSKFEGQPSLTYRVIEAAIRTASSDKSDSPGIIVLISSREDKETTYELASILVQLLSEPLNSVLIDAKPSLPDEYLKKEIDATIRGNLTENQMRAVLVRDLDQIPFEAAMIFHSYCDHENAPFKRVVYVMTAFVEGTISPNSGGKQWDMLASERLRTAWVNSGEDQVVSLISRLTGNVAAVLPK